MINEIRSRVQDGLFEFSKHALDQSIIRDISIRDMREAIASGRVIEDYPTDKYGPSCQCSHPSRPIIKVITLYEPDPDLWIDYETRKVQT